MKRVLIAGIGNIFLGDDAFGVETVQRLAQRPMPEGVHVRDFGIRSYDLAYALSDGYDAAILVDARNSSSSASSRTRGRTDLRSLTSRSKIVYWS